VQVLESLYESYETSALVVFVLRKSDIMMVRTLKFMNDKQIERYLNGSHLILSVNMWAIFKEKEDRKYPF
jgi:predicted membrane-bound dolichyl-phosphate-mannose-protein mannosyltransferase